jgi:drug/metabolite transporter (DMT)-like permease
LSRDARTLPTVLGIAAILFWSCTVGFVRSLTEQLGIFTAGAAAYLLAGVISCVHLFSSARRRHELVRLPRRYLWGCGSIFVLYTSCLYAAMGLPADRQVSVEVGLVNYLWPAMVMALSVPLLGSRARPWLAAGVLLGVAGTMVAPLGRGDFSWAGIGSRLAADWPAYLLALVAAVSWGFYSNLSRRWAGRAEGGAVPLFILATGLVLLAVRLAFAREHSTVTPVTVVELVFMAVFPAFLGYAFWDAAVRRGNMALVAALSYFTPVLATVVACLYLMKRPPGWQLWLGCGLVTAGALISKLAVSEPGPVQRSTFEVQRSKLNVQDASREP